MGKIYFKFFLGFLLVQVFLWQIFADTRCLYGYMDKEGKSIDKPQFEQAGSFSAGLAAVMKNHKR